MTVESGALACGRLPSSFSIDSIDTTSAAAGPPRPPPRAEAPARLAALGVSVLPNSASSTCEVGATRR